MWRGVPFLLVAAGAALLPSLAPALTAVAPVVLIYMLVGAAASLEFGWAGLPDFAIAAWFFAGTCCVAPITHILGLPFWACVPLGAAAITIIALVITAPLLRLSRETFAMATLAIALILPGVLAHQKLLAVPPIAIPVADVAQLYDVLIAALLLAGAFAVSIEHSPLGLALRGGAEDGTICGSIGLNARRCKLLVVAIAACTAAMAGCILPALQGGLNPASDGFGAVASIFAIAIIAGRRMSGAVVPALIIAGLPQCFPAFAGYRVILAGAVILCCVAWRLMSLKRGGNIALETFNIVQPTGAGAE